ncbi:MAG: DUF2232 domain-containing protein [Alphaproteobacteria bacterium]|nr:MAG: DUF2232 domain-containing protein [Alphaproteobacteria bacterium]
MTDHPPSQLGPASAPDGMRALMLAFALGGLSAALFSAFASGAPIALLLIYLAGVPFALAALALPIGYAGIAGATALLVLIPVGSWVLALVYSVVVLSPLALLCGAAMRPTVDGDGRQTWPQAGRLLVVLLALGSASVVGLALFGFGSEGFADQMVREVGAEFARLLGEEASNPQVEGSIRFIVGLPAVLCLSWLGMLTVNGLIAMAGARSLGWLRRPAINLSELEAPRWLLPVMAVALAAAVLGDGLLAFFGRNLSLVMTMALVFSGLAVVHALARRLGRRMLVLVPTYLGIVVFVLPLALVAVIGLVDQVVHVRRRLLAPPD